MRTILGIFVLAALAPLAAADTNVTGKWSGSFNSIGPDGEGRESAALLMLKQTGTEISGSFGPNEAEQIAISKGNIDGDKVTLVAEDQGRAIKFDLVLTGDRIKGDVSMSHNGQIAKAKIDVTRAQ
jgi:phage-related tail fiber protein